jgi:hypothetical protein
MRVHVGRSILWYAEMGCGQSTLDAHGVSIEREPHALRGEETPPRVSEPLTPGLEAEAARNTAEGAPDPLPRVPEPIEAGSEASTSSQALQKAPHPLEEWVKKQQEAMERQRSVTRARAMSRQRGMPASVQAFFFLCTTLAFLAFQKTMFKSPTEFFCATRCTANQTLNSTALELTLCPGPGT